MKADAPLLLISNTYFDKGSALLCRSYKKNEIKQTPEVLVK